MNWIEYLFYNSYLKNVIERSERFKRKKKILLKRSCQTQNPFRCNDPNYKQFTSHKKNKEAVNVDLKSMYQGGCIDESQRCDLKKDCINGDDEPTSCSRTPGKFVYEQKKENE